MKECLKGKLEAWEGALKSKVESHEDEQIIISEKP